MSDDELRRLIDEYFDGKPPEELPGLEEALATPQGQALLDQRLEMEQLLAVAHAPQAVEKVNRTRERKQPLQRKAVQQGSWGWKVAGAAAVLLVVAGLWRVLHPNEPARQTQPQYTLTEGSVSIDGTPAAQLREGVPIDVTSTGDTRIALKDGSTAEFTAGSRFRLHGASGEARQIVELLKGKGSFIVRTGRDRFRVETPVGKVSVLGTTFSVELRPRDNKEEAMKKELVFALAVAVTSGLVRVEFKNESVELSAGMSRVFGQEDAPKVKDPNAPKDGDLQVQPAEVQPPDTQNKIDATREENGNGRPKRGPREGEVRKEGPRDGDRRIEDNGNGQRRRPRDGDARKEGPRDGDAKKEGPRDGEARKEGPKDGDTRKEGPRDGEAPKEGPKDGDVKKDGPKDGDAPKEDLQRDPNRR